MNAQEKLWIFRIQTFKPIGFGVLTCENLRQAKTRSDVMKKNKGKEAAIACIKLL